MCDNKSKTAINKIKCKNCGDIIESKDLHDFKRCSCGKVAVDGGKEYFKIIGKKEEYIELQEKDIKNNS